MAWLLSPAELPLLAEEVLRAGLWRLKTVALGRWSSSDREWSPTRGKKTFILNPRRLTPIFRRGKRASRVNLEEKSPVGVLTKKVQSCEQARPCNSCDETLLHWAISATWRETERRRSTTCHWVFACVGGDWQRTKPWGTQRGPELACLWKSTWKRRKFWNVAKRTSWPSFTNSSSRSYPRSDVHPGSSALLHRVLQSLMVRYRNLLTSWAAWNRVASCGRLC